MLAVFSFNHLTYIALIKGGDKTGAGRPVACVSAEAFTATKRDLKNSRMNFLIKDNI